MITSTDNTQPTDGNLYSARRSDLNYISKKVDDTANGYIKFLKGIQGGQTFREGFLGEGASLYPINAFSLSGRISLLILEMFSVILTTSVIIA